MSTLNFDNDRDYDRLLYALDNKCSFSVEETNPNIYRVKVDNIFVWLFKSLVYSDYYLNQVKMTARILNDRLKEAVPILSGDPVNQDWVIARPIENSPALKATREFLKVFKDQFKKSDLAKENLAVKLGLPSSIFDENVNPGFFDFVDQYRIDRYLLTYKIDGKSALRWDSDTNEVFLLLNNVYHKWADAAKLLPLAPPRVPGRDYQQWVYGQEGLQNKDMFGWKELTPYQKEANHSWGDRYTFTFYAAGHGMSAQVQGSHCWPGIANPTGEKSSSGKYRMGGKPGRNWLWDIWTRPLKMVLANYQNPDSSLMWNTPYESITFEITKQGYLDIKKKIEKNKKAADGLEELKDDEAEKAAIFHNLYNCTDSTNDLAKLAGIDFNVRVSSARLVSPRFLVNATDAVYDYLPRIVIRVGEIALAVIFNSVQLFLGSNQISPEVKERFPNIKPLLTWWDLFDYQKTFIAHPWLIQQRFKEIIQWRKDEIAKVDPLSPHAAKLIEQINFQLPPNFYKSHDV
jgi:hypothetical protein